jgi:ubiquinone/menaquinone biosynthesis C-methylase UbiE
VVLECNIDVKRCPVCGATYGARIAHKDRYGVGATFTLCHRCSLIYLDPTASDEAYAEFYNGQYRKLAQEYRGKQDLEKNQVRYGNALAAFLEKTVGRVKTMVDIGGSTGIIAKAVVDRNPGCEVTVVDYNERELAKARSFGFKTIVGDARHVNGREYDLCLMCRSIDHCTRPLETMQNIERIIGRTGLAYVDHCDWLLIARAEGFTKSLHIDHPSNFTRESFNRLLTYSRLSPVAEYVPPMSSCYGYVLESAPYQYTKYEHIDIVSEVRRLQAEERKCQKSAY